MKSLQQILADFEPGSRGRHLTRRFQDLGLRLAQELGDPQHKSLYIKMAKTIPESVVEEALRFVKESFRVRSRPRLFKWRLKQLVEEKKPMKAA